MALSIEINAEILRELIASRGMIQRANNRISYEEALEAVKQIGKFCEPNFQIDKANEFAYECALRWCINDPQMKCVDLNGQVIPADPQKGLYIYGNVGTGKSMLLDICRTFCKLYRISIKSAGAVYPLAWKTWRADDICDEVAGSGDLRPWKEEICLCIQDLGNEPQEVLYMGNRRRVLRSVLEARGDMFDRLTFISSNLRPDKLTEFYGPRVSSRINQMCNFIFLGGQDRRR